jgi:hypothetical protein
VSNSHPLTAVLSPLTLPPLLRSSRRPILQPLPRSLQVALLSLQRSQTPLKRIPAPSEPNRLVSREQFCQPPSLLTTLVDTEVQRTCSLAICKSVNHRLDHRHAVLQRNVRRQVPGLATELAEFVAAIGPFAAGGELCQVATLDAAVHSLTLGIVHADIEWTVADAAESEIVAGSLAHSRAGSRIPVLAACVDCAAAVDVAAWLWDRSVQTIKLVGLQVCVHVSETDDLVAFVAFCGSRPVGDFVGCHAGE